MSCVNGITDTYFKIVLPVSFLAFMAGALISDVVGMYLLPAIVMGSMMIFALLVFAILINMIT